MKSFRDERVGPDAIVYAGARDVKNAGKLNDLAEKNDNLHIIKLVSNNVEDAKKAAETIEKVKFTQKNDISNYCEAPQYILFANKCLQHLFANFDASFHQNF